MQDELIKRDVHDFFQKLTEEAHEKAAKAPSLPMANEQIASMVGIKLAIACEGFVNDLCYDLSTQVEKEDFFQEPRYLNAFYDMDLEKKISEKYQFESTAAELKLDVPQANTVYQSLAAAAGTAAVGGILKYALAGAITIPVWLVLAASLLSGAGAYQLKTRDNRGEYLKALDASLLHLEEEVLDWLSDIEEYHHEQVSSLKKGLSETNV